jgi:hypothetical protein
MIPAISELIPQIDSKEQINISLITTDAKELYQELQQMRYSIAMAFENTQIVSDIVETENIHRIRIPSQRQLDSIERMNSADNIHDSKTDMITSDHKKLSLVGNAEKYSITQKKAQDRQIAQSTQRSSFRSQREYGEVYVRHRVKSFTFIIQLKSLE